MTDEAKGDQTGVVDPAKQSTTTTEVPRTTPPVQNWEHVAKTHKGRLEAATAELDQLKASQAESARKKLEEKEEFKTLYEAEKAKNAEDTAEKQRLSEANKELLTFKEKQIEDSINKTLDGVPEEDKKSFIEDTKGMDHEARMRILEKLSKSINRKPKDTPMISGQAGESKDLKTSLLDKINAKIKQ